MIIPLVADPLVIASLITGVSGLVNGNLGVPTPIAYGPWGSTRASPAAGIEFYHPGMTSPSAMTFRAGAFTYEATSSTFGASQPEEIVVERHQDGRVGKTWTPQPAKVLDLPSRDPRGACGHRHRDRRTQPPPTLNPSVPAATVAPRESLEAVRLGAAPE